MHVIFPYLLFTSIRSFNSDKTTRSNDPCPSSAWRSDGEHPRRHPVRMGLQPHLVSTSQDPRRPARPVGHRRCGAGAAFRASRNACGRCQRRRMKTAKQVCERGEAQPRSARPPGGPSWCPLLLAHQPDVRRPSAYRSGDRRSQTWGLSRCESFRVVPRSRLLGEAQTWGAKVVRELLADLLRGLLAGHPLCSLK